MERIININENSELIITSFGECIRDLYLEKMPTVCIISANNAPDRHFILPIIKKIIEIGGKFFVLWGEASDDLHDVIDTIIEEGNEEWLNILTTSHKEEKLKDVIWFFLKATHFEPEKFRLLALIDDESKENYKFKEELKKQYSSQPHIHIGTIDHIPISESTDF